MQEDIYCSCIHRTHRSLRHLHALVPHLVDDSCNVHHLLLLDLLQDIVNADEGTSMPNTMHHRVPPKMLSTYIPVPYIFSPSLDPFYHIHYTPQLAALAIWCPVGDVELVNESIIIDTV